MIEIREERPEDIGAIREVNKRAFGQDQEVVRTKIKVVQRCAGQGFSLLGVFVVG